MVSSAKQTQDPPLGLKAESVGFLVLINSPLSSLPTAPTDHPLGSNYPGDRVSSGNPSQELSMRWIRIRGLGSSLSCLSTKATSTLTPEFYQRLVLPHHEIPSHPRVAIFSFPPIHDILTLVRTDCALA